MQWSAQVAIAAMATGDGGAYVDEIRQVAKGPFEVGAEMVVFAGVPSVMRLASQFGLHRCSRTD